MISCSSFQLILNILKSYRLNYDQSTGSIFKQYKNGARELEVQIGDVLVYNNNQRIAHKMMNQAILSQQNSNEDMQIEGLGTIYTSRNQKYMITHIDSPNQIDRILGSLNMQNREIPLRKKPTLITKQILLQCRTSCSQTISRETKKKIRNIRNRNINYFITKSNNRYVIETCENILARIKSGKKIEDPSKSLTFFFLQLALLAQYRSSDAFFNIFDTCETTKKNKKTKPCSQEEKAIITEELQFFKEVAQEFYDNPLRAILMAYLRNHEIAKLQRGNLDSWTRNAIKQTIKILNEQPFNSNIEAELPLRL